MSNSEQISNTCDMNFFKLKKQNNYAFQIYKTELIIQMLNHVTPFKIMLKQCSCRKQYFEPKPLISTDAGWK